MVNCFARMKPTNHNTEIPPVDRSLPFSRFLLFDRLLFEALNAKVERCNNPEEVQMDVTVVQDMKTMFRLISTPAAELRNMARIDNKCIAFRAGNTCKEKAWNGWGEGIWGKHFHFVPFKSTAGNSLRLYRKTDSVEQATKFTQSFYSAFYPLFFEPQF